MATFATSRLNRLPAAERGITIGDFLVPVGVGERISVRARHIGLIVAGALFIALTANYAVPVPGSPVPVTGQTLSVLLVAGALGFKRGALATLLYLILGLFLPVYAGHRSGIGVIGTVEGGRLVLGATGGYLIGFVFASALVGRLAELGWDRNLLGAVGAMLLGSAVIYAIGVPWLAYRAFGGDLSMGVQEGMLPFLLWDAVKLLLAAVAFPAAWWFVGRRPGDR
jgi:biotin transport system substrate-specific component